MGRPLKRVIPPDPAKPETWFTRGEVAELLGCSVRTVERLEGKRLFPFLDTHGVHRLNPNEVHAIRHKARGLLRGPKTAPTAGDMAAAVFDLLEQRKSKVEIVRQLHLEPREVQRLWEEWSTGFEDSVEAKKKAELRARHETRQRHAAELASRERVERLKVERESTKADAQAQRDLARLLRRTVGTKPRKAAAHEATPEEAPGHDNADK